MFHISDPAYSVVVAVLLVSLYLTALQISVLIYLMDVAVLQA